MKRTLKESIEFVGNNKQLASVFAKQLGVATFEECKEVVDLGILDNDTNRDEELDSIDLYINKISHNIRYVSGVSEKGQLMVSVLRDKVGGKGYIRDNGTMFGLCFGEYFDSKFIDGHTWLAICEDVVTEYGIDDKDSEFIKLINKFFDSKNQSEMDLKYSLSDIVNSSDEIKKIYYGTTIAFVVNLMTRKQHQRDMINCNKQPNPWIAYNYYMTVHKDTEAYRTSFLGKELLKWVQDKEGLATFTKGKLMNTYKATSESKKVNVFVPLAIAYCITNYVDSVDELNKSYNMIVKFSNHNDKEVNKYWTEMFGRMVEDAQYKEMQDFYNKQYIKVFESTTWDNVTAALKSLIQKKCKGTETTAMQGLQIKKFDTGIWFLSTVLWFKERNKKIGYDKIISETVANYNKLLNGNVGLGDGTEVKLYNYFGNEASIYKSASADIRMSKVFQYVTKELAVWFAGRSKDRDVESQLRKSVLDKLSVFVDEESITPVLYVYPLSTNELAKFNISNGDGLHWLHKKPHGAGGDAKDGFLGLVDDNLDGNVKYKNWNFKSPSDYWVKIIERNEKALPTITDSKLAKKVKRSIETLEEMLEIDLTA